MHTPQNNPEGYTNSAINNATALQQNVRFLIMHGVADDNVHIQNTLTLLDKLDVASVENYDVHVFPDSDHSIYFRMLSIPHIFPLAFFSHTNGGKKTKDNANKMVYDRLATWITMAFNGEFLKWDGVRPKEEVGPYDANEDDDHDHDEGHEKKRLGKRSSSSEGRGRSMLRSEIEKLALGV